MSGIILVADLLSRQDRRQHVRLSCRLVCLSARVDDSCRTSHTFSTKAMAVIIYRHRGKAEGEKATVLGDW
jgi:hypothetical protein